jgi:antitoxin VapB
MSLNIKNERTHALVRELAELTGQSQTSAVEDAVRRRLDELHLDAQSQRDERLRRLRDLSRRGGEIARRRGLDSRAALDDLYDENGLPR